jgi:hypothetical protein
MEKVELDKLTKLIDDFVTQLKKDLIVVQYKPAKTGILPGVWDRMKNWWHNTVMGGNNPDNPYVYKNKFGALGREDDTKKESRRLTLSQYNFIKEQYNKLEYNLSVINEDLETESENLKKLKLFRIIDDWASKFKQEVIRQFSAVHTSNDNNNGESRGEVRDEVEKPSGSSGTEEMSGIPNRSGGSVNSDLVAAERETRRPGRKPDPRIYWTGDKWENITSSEAVNKIKKEVWKRLRRSKHKGGELFQELYVGKNGDQPPSEYIPTEEFVGNFENFEKDFKESFKDILDHSEEIFKKYPDKAIPGSVDPKDQEDWMKWLINETMERQFRLMVNKRTNDPIDDLISQYVAGGGDPDDQE